MRELMDTDGENRAVRAFLMHYGAPGLSVGQMKTNLRRSGWDRCWPAWCDEPGEDQQHLTKAGAQLWLRYLFALESEARPTGPEPVLMQDANRKLHKALASKPDSRLQAREAAAAIQAQRDPADKLRRCSLGCLEFGQCKANMHGCPSECPALGVADQRPDGTGTPAPTKRNAGVAPSHDCPNVKGNPREGYYCNVCEGGPCTRGVGVVATTERVEVGRLVLPAFDGDEYGEPEIDAFMGRIEAVQQRVQKTRARAELAVFVEVPAAGVAPSDAVSDEALDRLTKLMLDWGRKQYWSSGAYSLKQFKDEARAALGVTEAPASQQFPYDRTFAAIAAATSTSGAAAINVSVKAFIEAWNAYPPRGVAPSHGPSATELWQQWSVAGQVMYQQGFINALAAAGVAIPSIQQPAMWLDKCGVAWKNWEDAKEAGGEPEPLYRANGVGGTDTDAAIQRSRERAAGPQGDPR